MAIPLPTLSGSGWITEIAEKTDRLFAYFFVSEYSQTHLYKGNVTSLPFIVQQYGHDEFAIGPNLEKSLHLYLSRYYDDVRIEVTVTSNGELGEGSTELDIRVDAVLTEDGKQYSLGRLISTVDSKIMKIIKINNG